MGDYTDSFNYDLQYASSCVMPSRFNIKFFGGKKGKRYTHRVGNLPYLLYHARTFTEFNRRSFGGLENGGRFSRTSFCVNEAVMLRTNYEYVPGT
jgi:hypothetical protein